MRTLTKRQLIASIGLVFLLAIIPTLVDLGDDMLCADANHWIKRSSFFTKAISSGDFSESLQSRHPGVTRMWLSGPSMGAYVFFRLWREGGLDQLEKLSSIKYQEFFQKFPRVLFFAKLPSTLLISISLIICYMLLRKLLPEEIALLASVLMALDPFFIAHSRVIQLDALMTIFLLISVLGLQVYLTLNQRKYLFLSGIAGGLALLTKSPALFLIPFVFLAVGLKIFEYTGEKKGMKPDIMKMISVIPLNYILLMLIVIVILYPAMWTNPIETLRETYGSIIGEVTSEVIDESSMAHEIGNFFMGRYVDDPGWLFYPIALLFRSTPVSLIFTLCCIGILIKGRLPKQIR